MKRFFISQYPTFGSYSNPIASKVNTSPYFWWWLALTLNRHYIACCEMNSAVSIMDTSKSTRRIAKAEMVDVNAIRKVLKHFGDVRYEGDKYVAFAKWWRAKVNDTETRGEYLFAEPLVPNKVELVKDEVMAMKVVKDASSLLINIPKSLTRKQIDTAIERIFLKEMSFEKGRQTRNPNRSNARFKLSSPITVASYKMAFDIFEEDKLAKSIGKKLSNYELAKKVGLKIETKLKEEFDRASKVRTIGIAVTRKKKTANDAIINVANGVFP